MIKARHFILSQPNRFFSIQPSLKLVPHWNLFLVKRSLHYFGAAIITSTTHFPNDLPHTPVTNNKSPILFQSTFFYRGFLIFPRSMRVILVNTSREFGIVLNFNHPRCTEKEQRRKVSSVSISSSQKILQLKGNIHTRLILTCGFVRESIMLNTNWLQRFKELVKLTNCLNY